MDCGDNIVVVNAEKVQLTGNKREREHLLLAHRLSRRHQGAQPRARSSTASIPSASSIKAVERMMPRGPLGRQVMKNLRVYAGPNHPHEAQQPETLDVAAMNRKNTRAERWLTTINRRNRPRQPAGSGAADLPGPGQPAPGDRRRPRRRTAAPATGAMPSMKPKIDAQGRAYATGKRKNAVARVWIKPGNGKITVNGRDSPVYFARPVLRMLHQPAVRRRQPARPVRRRLHGQGRRAVGPGRRGAPRHQQGADLLRAGTAPAAEEPAAS